MYKAQLSKYAMWLFVSIMFTTASVVKAQTLRIVPQSSTVTIFGTSTIHDWESKVEQPNGELILSNSKQIQSLVVKIPVRSIKSGKGLMDTKTYDAFNADQNPLIVFQLTEATPLRITGKDIEATLTGNLTMAGVTKRISFKTTGKIIGEGVYQFKGSVPLKMTEFKMKPPTAMLGTMKTGDAITIKFEVTVK
jgi:polyisoprenoid-binding protein YceI